MLRGAGRAEGAPADHPLCLRSYTKGNWQVTVPVCPASYPWRNSEGTLPERARAFEEPWRQQPGSQGENDSFMLFRPHPRAP